MTLFRFPGWRALVLATAFATLAGCGGDDDDEADAGRATLRAVHASADAGPVDIRVNGERIAAGATFRQATAPASVPAAPTRIQVNPAGSATSAIDVTAPLARDRRYAAVALGSAAAGTPAAQALGAVLVEDANDAPAAGNAKLRVLHAAPAAGSVDVYVSAPGAALPATATIPNLAFRAAAPASGAAALQVPAGDYRVRVTPAGDRATIAYDSGTVPVAAGADLLLIAVPAGGGASPIALLAVPATGDAATIGDSRAAVRVGHFAPNVGAVDAFLRAPGAVNAPANRVVANATFGAATGYLPAPAGPARASVALAGGTTEAIGLDANLAAGTSTSVFAVGLAGGSGAQQLRLLPFADDRAPVAGRAKVRVIHLSPDAPAVDVVVLGAGGAIAARPVTNLAFPSATASPLTLDPGTYTVAVVPAGAATPVLPSAAGVPLTLGAGQVRTVVAAGCLGTSTGACAGGQPFRLVVLQDD